MSKISGHQCRLAYKTHIVAVEWFVPINSAFAFHQTAIDPALAVFQIRNVI